MCALIMAGNSTLLPPSTETLSEFDLGQMIGHGGFSKVFSARRRNSGERVALKVIDATYLSPENRERVDREILLHSAASFETSTVKQKREKDRYRMKKDGVSENAVDESSCSSHLVKLYSWFCDADRIYLVMELCPHGDLYQLKQEIMPNI